MQPVLTQVGPDDVDDLVLLYTDPVVAHWTGPWTRTSVEAWAVAMAARWATDRVGKWMARDRSDASLTWAADHHPDLPVVAFTEVHDHASRAVMERLGLRPAGIIRRPGLVEGRTGVQPDAPFALYRL